jgi:hypothetical protein
VEPALAAGKENQQDGGFYKKGMSRENTIPPYLEEVFF